MDISVIVPLFNEEESLPELFAWIKRVMDTNDFTYEVIFERRFYRPFMECHRRACREVRAGKGHQVPPQLRKESGTLLRIQGGTGRCSHHHGCRPAGFS